MGLSGHPGDVEGSSSLGDLVGDLVCVLTHAGVTGKPICIGFVPVFPRSAPHGILTCCVVLVTIGAVLSVGRRGVVAPISFRVSFPSSFLWVIAFYETHRQ